MQFHEISNFLHIVIMILVFCFSLYIYLIKNDMHRAIKYLIMAMSIVITVSWAIVAYSAFRFYIYYLVAAVGFINLFIGCLIFSCSYE